MKVTQEEMIERQAVLQIELEPAEMEPFLDRAYRRLVQRTTIPGFRKGKAPRWRVEQVLGRDVFLSEAIDFLVPEATAQAVKEQELEAVARPLVDVVQVDPAILKATVPLKPAVDLGSYRDLRLKKEPVELTAEEIQEILEELRRTMAPWEPVERPVEEDDLVTMHVHAEIEGKVLTDQQDVPYFVREDSDRPFAGFGGQIVGIAPGETKEFTTLLPETYEDPDVAGKDAQFKVTVLDVKERRLPELDDEFAKGVGQGYDSMVALKEQVEQDLMAQKKQAVEDKLKEQALEKIIEGSAVELPSLLVDHEIEHLVENWEQSLSRGGMSLEAYLQTAGKSPEELRQEVREEAVRRLTRAWVLAQVAEEEGLEVNAEELDLEVARLAEGVGQQGEAVRKAFARKEARDSLSQMVLARKATQFLAEITQAQETKSASVGSISRGKPQRQRKTDKARKKTPEGGTRDAE